jgi:hypothetical protein
MVIFYVQMRSKEIEREQKIFTLHEQDEQGQMIFTVNKQEPTILPDAHFQDLMRIN